MSATGKKLIAAAEEAVTVAKCDHDLVLLRRPVTTAPPTFDRFSCQKCAAVIWVPISNEQRPKP